VFGGEMKRAGSRRKLVEEEGIPIEKDRVRLSREILFWRQKKEAL
jgi:hypothetical protein